MSECSECGGAVYVPADFEFEDGDRCWQCEIKALQAEVVNLHEQISVLKRLLRLIESDSPTWAYVMAFAMRMEMKLAKNRHKGDANGWRRNTAMELHERLHQEANELEFAIKHHSGEPELIVDEAADVANFAMMIADVATWGGK